jgi:hypothetical protein
MDPREEKLPRWAKELIADLRKRVQYGNEPLLREISQLRPQVELLKRRNEALTELLGCAARGEHKYAIEIMGIIQAYNLTLTKEGD